MGNSNLEIELLDCLFITVVPKAPVTFGDRKTLHKDCTWKIYFPDAILCN